MPTTRSRKRPSEEFEQLEAPTRTRKQRKTQRPISPELAEEAVRTTYPSPLRAAPTIRDQGTQTETLLGPIYADASTQTDPVCVLTQTDLDAAINPAVDDAVPVPATVESPLKKRSRDVEDGAEQASKRVQLTPGSSGSNTRWAFPASAPPKPFFAPSTITPGRIVRGPISQNTAARLAAKRRNAQFSRSGAATQRVTKTAPFDLKPIVRDVATMHSLSPRKLPAHNGGEHEQQQVVEVEEPVRRSLFGSVSNLARSGINFAMNLSPLRRPQIAHDTFDPRPMRKVENPLNSEQDSSRANTHEENIHTQDDSTVNESASYKNATNSEQHSRKIARTHPETPRTESALAEANRASSIPCSQSYEQYLWEPTILSIPGAVTASPYDKFHYIKKGSEEEQRLLRGEHVEPPKLPRKMSELEFCKAKYPGLSEAELKALLSRKTSRLALAGVAQPRGPHTDAVRAPLFGPHSHYERGTVDPNPSMRASLSSLSNTNVGEKRRFDTYAAPAPAPAFDRQAYVEDEADASALEAEVSIVDEEMGENTIIEEDVPETPVPKRQKTAYPTTPRSALKRPGTTPGIFGRSARFDVNPVSATRDVRAHYGPAGQYRGSTFADLASPPSRDSTASTLDRSDVISPLTQSNTIQNATRRLDVMAELQKNLGANIPEIDFTLRDPNRPEWRPTLANPRPGTFRVPYDDEDSMEEDEDEQETPTQPSTPRMSHAELPAAPSSSSSSSANTQPFGQSFNESSIAFESTELALEKARSKAQKYKPKDSSRLSEVSKPVSRSPSPDKDDDTSSLTSLEDSTPAVEPVDGALVPWSQRTPYVEVPADNTVRGEDGMTEYEREHQHDEWAAALPWSNPQTYEEAGVGTSDIHNLIRRNWGPEDDRRGEQFWQAEFDDIERLSHQARANGHRLRFITGMEDVDSYLVEASAA